MMPDRHSPILPQSWPAYDRIGFDPWTAEIATLDVGSAKLSRLVYRFFSLVFAGSDFLADAIRSRRKARPIEIESVNIPTAASPAEPESADRRAAA